MHQFKVYHFRVSDKPVAIIKAPAPFLAAKRYGREYYNDTHEHLITTNDSSIEVEVVGAGEVNNFEVDAKWEKKIKVNELEAVAD